MVERNLADDLDAWMHALAELLVTNRSLWAERPFVEQPVTWETEYREVSSWLRRLDLAAIDAHEGDAPFPSDAPRDLKRWTEVTTELSVCPQLPAVAPPRPGGDFLRGIRARKWTQIEAFGAAVLGWIPSHASRLVDWCAGKGHLGRTLGWSTGLPAVLIEQRADLCKTAADLATRDGVVCEPVTADATTPEAWAHIGPGALCVGLHACGHLTDALARQADARGAAAIAVAPCCHHRIEPRDRYRPLSDCGRSADIGLDDSGLRLPTADEQVARARRRRSRRREMDLRLGLDLLLREATGEDSYRPLGPLPVRFLDLGFRKFCIETAAHLDLQLPSRWDPGKSEAAGRERARIARGLGLVRCLFRRPLELWLVLDRALFLQERGRDVRIGTFCAPEITPRNLAILAV